jgi:tetratricopeptide (TPR) repeat protein
LLVVIGLIALEFFLLAQLGGIEGLIRVGEDVYSMVIVGLFFLVLLAILVIAGFFLVPDIGEIFSGTVFNPAREEKLESPYKPALAALNRGDYEEAVDIYLRLTRENPEDIHAVCEAARITSQKLNDPDRAIDMLSDWLDAEHSAENSMQLAFFLADLAARDAGRYDYAEEVLNQIVETMPATPHALHATQELKKIEQMREKDPEAQAGAKAEADTTPDSEAETGSTSTSTS